MESVDFASIVGWKVPILFVTVLLLHVQEMVTELRQMRSHVIGLRQIPAERMSGLQCMISRRGD